MNIIHNLRQWIFEHLIAFMGMGACGILYEVGSIWYQNARIVGSAYGYSI